MAAFAHRRGEDGEDDREAERGRGEATSASRHHEGGSASAAGMGSSTTASGSNARGTRSSASPSAREDDAVARREPRGAHAPLAPTIAAPRVRCWMGRRLGAKGAARETRRGATTRGRNAADAARTFVMGGRAWYSKCRSTRAVSRGTPRVMVTAIGLEVQSDTTPRRRSVVQRQVAHFAGGHSDHHPIPRTCCYWHISDTGWHPASAPNPHTGRARVRDGDVEMRETIDRAWRARVVAARGDGASASELKPDFTPAWCTTAPSPTSSWNGHRGGFLRPREDHPRGRQGYPEAQRRATEVQQHGASPRPRPEP